MSLAIIENNIRYYRPPQFLQSDRQGYEYISAVVNDLMDVKEEHIYFDFSDTQHFEINLCAIFGAVFHMDNNIDRKFFFRGVDKTLKRFLQKINFLVPDPSTDSTEEANMVNFARFRIEDEGSIRDYISQKLLKVPGLPVIHPQLEIEIVRQILEMYENATTHGGCEYVYSCGITDSRRKELHFTLTDIGRTIKLNVNDFLNQMWSGKQTIDWSTKDDHSTKKNQSGGFGLKLIQRFIRNNGGRLQIISAEGLWEYNGGNARSENMKIQFPGTIVNIIFNLKDDNLHYLNDLGTPEMSKLF